jgi:2-polyprenyl-6-hydroxyphenyl methylase / 3-demethylubiquinone-9 3-methyltransferase
MKQVFDQVASRFARSIDGTMRAGHYARGNHFIGLAQHAFPRCGYLLDFGCGPGRLSLLLAQAGFRVVGVDISHGMIAEARQLDTQGLPVEFLTIERAEEALAPAAYDGIVCSSVIEYVADADSLLQGFRRSLRDSGALLISFANRASIFRWYWERVAPPNPMGAAQRHVWTWPEFRAVLARNGFAPATRPRYFEWPWDARALGSPFTYARFLGSIGVVVARPI